MCGNSKGCCKGGCTIGKIAKVLLIIGGINWGLVGLGMLLGDAPQGYNVVSIIFGSVPNLEPIIYVLVGIAAIMKIFGCCCKKCKDGTGASCCSPEKKEEVKM